jgi:hypothetical protein
MLLDLGAPISRPLIFIVIFLRYVIALTLFERLLTHAIAAALDRRSRRASVVVHRRRVADDAIDGIERADGQCVHRRGFAPPRPKAKRMTL